MKVSEIAYLAGTTVRTVRWYHSVRLLPTPDGRPRDYNFGHLARLVRIRWLAQSGMSLRAIAQILDDSPQTNALDDLDAALVRIDEEIRSLKAQRERIVGLRELARTGAALSPLPAEIDQIYARVRARLTDPEHREILDCDRVLALLAGAMDTLPDLSSVSVAEADIEKMVEAVELFGEARHTDDIEDLVNRFVDIQAELIARFDIDLSHFFTTSDGVPRTERLLLALRIAYPGNGPQEFVKRCLIELGLSDIAVLDAQPDGRADPATRRSPTPNTRTPFPTQAP